MTIYTLGHSTRTADEFIELLKHNDIATAVDVRRFPGSRRYPQFGREALAASLTAAGIRYVHEPALGGRRPARADSPNVAWRNSSFRGYADYMATDEFRDALARLIEMGAASRTAVFCAEAVPWRCHRRLIADALVARGIEVCHILSETRVDEHSLNPDAFIDPGGAVTYPGENQQASLF